MRFKRARKPDIENTEGFFGPGSLGAAGFLQIP